MNRIGQDVMLEVGLHKNLFLPLSQLYLLSKKREIQTTNETIESEELHLKQLQKTLERENIIFEEFLKENDKKSVEAKAL